MKENTVMELQNENEKVEVSKEEFFGLISRTLEESKNVADNQLSKEEGGLRLWAVLADFGKQVGEELDEEPTDPDMTVILEETMDFLVRLRQRLSAKTLEEFGQILAQIEKD